MDSKRKALAILAAAAPLASAQSEFDSLGFVAGLFGILSLFLSYRLIYAKNGLDAQIMIKTLQLRKLKEEAGKYEADIRHHRQTASIDLDARVSSEMEKAKGGQSRFEGLDKNYWQRIGVMEEPAQATSDIQKLKDEKTALESIITLTKSKYLEMDRKSFDNIMEGYQRKLIEIEAKLKGIGGAR